MSQRSRYLLWGAGVLVIFAVLGGLMGWRYLGRAGVPSDDIRALIAVTTVQEDGSQAADLIAYVRLRPEQGQTEVVLVPGTTRVDMPGVTDDRLRDIYPYGGAPLLKKAFEQRFGVPVDVACAIDETGAVRVMGLAPPITVTPERHVDLFRRDRYLSFEAGKAASLDATAAMDLLAAAAHSEPPGQDMTLQAQLVREALPALAGVRPERLPEAFVDPCGDKTTLRRVASAAAGAGWSSAEVTIAPGVTVEEEDQAYFEPDISWWETLRR